MSKFQLNILFIYLIISMGFVCPITAQYQIEKGIFGDGGGKINNTNQIVISTIGQPVIGNSSDISFRAHFGFWHTMGFIVGMKELLDILPKRFELSQNYPNPFNSGMHIDYAIPKSTHVRLEVYNVLGQRVTTLVNEKKQPGFYTVYFDAGELASGLYIYCIQGKEINVVKKMVLMK